MKRQFRRMCDLLSYLRATKMSAPGPIGLPVLPLHPVEVVDGPGVGLPPAPAEVVAPAKTSKKSRSTVGNIIRSARKLAGKAVGIMMVRIVGGVQGSD